MRLPKFTIRLRDPEVRSIPDLQTQLESLLDCVWKSEADWRFDDRLTMALRLRRSSR
jgi:hypothetical protein